uniref:Uncharacterized protein n=1 Tax=Sphaerodactylus townsendi TaxID=933632 RepID=A0ACB8FHN4_9SAUR
MCTCECAQPMSPFRVSSEAGVRFLITGAAARRRALAPPREPLDEAAEGPGGDSSDASSVGRRRSCQLGLRSHCTAPPLPPWRLQQGTLQPMACPPRMLDHLDWQLCHSCHLIHSATATECGLAWSGGCSPWSGDCLHLSGGTGQKDIPSKLPWSHHSSSALAPPVPPSTLAPPQPAPVPPA